MTGSRRDFLKAGFTAAAAAAIPLETLAAAQRAGREPVLGMIFPPANYPVPPDATQLYPTGVKFLARGVGLEAMTPDGYDKAIPKVLPAAISLKEEGATAISVMGTSLTFYKGRRFNEDLTEQVRKATGLPATTMSTGIIDGLKASGARRVAVATAYTDEVTNRLKVFLEEHGFVVAFARGMGYLRVPQDGTINDDRVFDYSAETFEKSSKAEALLISCGGLKTLNLIVPLEARCKVPVVSSTPHALWNGVRLAGLSGRAQGYGRIIAGA